MVKIISPAKLILSGEHSIVRNKPALTVALNYFTQCEVSANNLASGVKLIIPQLKTNKTYSWAELIKLEISLQHRYQNFTDAFIPIGKVLKKPIDLCWFAIIYFLKNAQKNNSYQQSSITINLSSEIPIGSGMGSSASIIIAIMQSLNKFYNFSLCDNTVYQLALQTENLQHGYSSGIDIKTIMHSGINYFQNNNTIHSNSNITINKQNFFLINTGKPSSSTGECGEKVKENFPDAHHIWTKFSRCTNLLKISLEQEDKSEIIKHIKTNHRLLNQLNIVPHHINNFIKKIESLNGAAKICGAGSVSGDTAGMVLAIGDFSPIKKSCDQYNFSIENLADRIFYGR